jgi:ABC-type multidrug transport system ATPase subunit
MLYLTAEGLGKKYRRDWVFRRLDLTLSAGNSYTFVGPNGSGKSTLLQILSGAMPATEGQLTFSDAGQPIAPDAWFRQVVMAAPYLELVEELTLHELLVFHQTFKPFRNNLTPNDVATLAGLGGALTKEIKYFSSGMKQRARLALAFCSDAPLLILDEPTANLDRAGAAWYHDQIRQLTEAPNRAPRLLLIGSNQPAEYDFCPNVIDITRWKQAGDGGNRFSDQAFY